MASKSVFIIGSGIAGLAHAWMAAQKGCKVTVFEKDSQPSGASVQNFGLIWPIGQSHQTVHLALRSAEHWRDIARKAKFWTRDSGALFPIYTPFANQIAEEFLQVAKDWGYKAKWMSAKEFRLQFPLVQSKDLIGALFSKTELQVQPKEALPAIITYLREVFHVEFRFGQQALSVEKNAVVTANEKLEADLIFFTTGINTDLNGFEFDTKKVNPCKLQMLRTKASMFSEFNLPPVMASELSLQHYPSFNLCSSIGLFRQKTADENPLVKKFGLNILTALQNDGSLVIGDSHEYGKESESPEYKMEIEQAILNYLSKMLKIEHLQIEERWIGRYLKSTEDPFITKYNTPHHLLMGLGGGGMTLSFALAEKFWKEV
ncbi:MAG: TIGR03364 family FAD-dependent oxidoreductase [Chitinophagales bacterium]|nr:TIGR03364 family FAD-dependent oxidoreductase [Chitinophagales bacterium]